MCARKASAQAAPEATDPNAIKNTEAMSMQICLIFGGTWSRRYATPNSAMRSPACAKPEAMRQWKAGKAWKPGDSIMGALSGSADDQASGAAQPCSTGCAMCEISARHASTVWKALHIRVVVSTNVVLFLSPIARTPHPLQVASTQHKRQSAARSLTAVTGCAARRAQAVQHCEHRLRSTVLTLRPHRHADSDGAR